MAGRLIARLIALALIAGLAAGCGNKGPLYLPDTDAAGNSSQPQSDSP